MDSMLYLVLIPLLPAYTAAGLCDRRWLQRYAVIKCILPITTEVLAVMCFQHLRASGCSHSRVVERGHSSDMGLATAERCAATSKTASTDWHAWHGTTFLRAAESGAVCQITCHIGVMLASPVSICQRGHVSQFLYCSASIVVPRVRASKVLQPIRDRRSRMFALTSNGKEGTRAKGLVLSPNRRALTHAPSGGLVASFALLPRIC